MTHQGEERRIGTRVSAGRVRIGWSDAPLGRRRRRGASDDGVGELLELSISGAAVVARASTTLVCGSRVAIKLGIGPGLAVVRRVDPTSDPRTSRYSIEFVQLSPAAQEFVNRLTVTSGPRPSDGRAPAGPALDAAIDGSSSSSAAGDHGSSGEPRRLLPVVLFLALVGIGDALGLAFTLAGDNSLAVGVAFATFVAAGFVCYRSLRRAHGQMIILDEFSAGLGQSVISGDAVLALLSRTHRIMGADWTWLITANDSRVGTMEYSGGEVTEGLAQPADLELVARLPDFGGAPVVMRSSGSDLGQRRVHHVVAAALPVSDGGIVILAVGRRSRWGQFSASEMRLFDRIALHGGVAIQNVRLLRRLRNESDLNRHQADHDPLTGLANRTRFREIAAQLVTAGRTPGVLLIDLDRFKEVNDTLGHHNGDLLLTEAAMRMRQVVGADVVLARLGGDEFAALVDADGDEFLMMVTADNLRSEMRKPFKIGAVQVDVGASIGIALAHSWDEDVGDILRRADVAMYAAKTDQSGVEIYRESLDLHSTERLELVPRLRSAIEGRELVLHFQPQIELGSGRVVGAETLVRWPAAGVGFIAPDDFLPAAEQTDLIRPLTRFVLEEAIAQCARWHANGHALRVSVNLSARNLLEPDLAEHILGLVADAALPRDALRVELTETAFVARPEETARVLHLLRSNGISVALDDFGTGHSSLTHLMAFPVDEIKIDKSFVLQLGCDPVAARVVRTVIELGNNLGLDVVAEGVETAVHADELLSMGCGVAQGYFFARPMTPSDFEAWLAQHDRWTTSRPHAEPFPRPERQTPRPSLV